MSPDERIAAIARCQHGVYTRGQALDAGATPEVVRQRLKSKRWLRLRRSVYADAGAPVTEEQRVMAAVLSMGARAVAASLTAAWLQGPIEKPPHRVYVAMPSGQHRRTRKGLLIIEAALARTDVRTVNGIRTTAPNRTIVDCAAVLSRDRLATVFDDAVLLGLTSVVALKRYIKERHLQHRKGAQSLRLVLDDRTKGVPQKGLERLFLGKIHASHLPDPVRQHPCGRRKIDFAYPDASVAIELDGLRNHFSDEDFKADRRRQNEIVLAGYHVLRFTKEDVEDRWPVVEATIRRALPD